jgi:DNA repair ATPase RecN
MFYSYISWPPHCDEPEDDLCRRLAEDWEPIETLRELMETLEPVIRSEERWHIGGSEGKLGYAQELLAALTKNARGSSNMISKHFTKKTLPEVYQIGYTLLEDLEITKGSERGMYYLDFKRQLDKHLNESGTLTEPIATAIYTVKARGPSEVVGSLEEAKARIAELESLLGRSQREHKGTQRELTGTQRELTETQKELSVTQNKLSMTEAQLSEMQAQYSRANSTLRFLSGLGTDCSFK